MTKLFKFYCSICLVAFALIAVSSCDDENETPNQKTGPVKQKTEKAVTDLKTQNTTAVDFNATLQKAKEPQLRSSVLFYKIEAQKQIVEERTAYYNKIYDQVINGENAIPGFANAAQKHANAMALNMNDLAHRTLVHQDFIIAIQKNQVAAIPFNPLSIEQKWLLNTFSVAVYDLGRAIEILNRLTGGVERTESTVIALQNWIHRLSTELMDVLESTGEESGIDVESSSTKQVLDRAEAMIRTMNESDLVPYKFEIDRINQEIKNVQDGLDEVLNFWNNLQREIAE